MLSQRVKAKNAADATRLARMGESVKYLLLLAVIMSAVVLRSGSRSKGRETKPVGQVDVSRL